MGNPLDDARTEALTNAVARLEQVLETVRQDPRAYAALAAAIAFVEVVIDRQAGDRKTESLTRPTEALPPVRDKP